MSGSKQQNKVIFSRFWVFLMLIFFVAFPVISYQLGHLKGSLERFTTSVDVFGKAAEQLGNQVDLLEENITLKTALLESEERRQHAEDAFAKAAFGLGFTNSLAIAWENRNAAREIIIQKLLEKVFLSPKSIYQINRKKKTLDNGDVVRCARNLSFADFDSNGYVFPHLLEKMPVGIYVRLPGVEQGFIYNLKENIMYFEKIRGVIPQQNLLILR